MSAISRLSNSKLAFLVALILLALAGSFFHFVHPGGFEGQLVWFLALLPGILPAEAIGLLADNLPAGIGTILFRTAFVLCNLLWYWLVSYGAVKLMRRSKPWDGF